MQAAEDDTAMAVKADEEGLHGTRRALVGRGAKTGQYWGRSGGTQEGSFAGGVEECVVKDGECVMGNAATRRRKAPATDISRRLWACWARRLCGPRQEQSRTTHRQLNGAHTTPHHIADRAVCESYAVS
jgi:hypothetical protein